MQTRRQQDISISDRVHRILEKEKIGAAGRLLEDSLGLADICPEVISKLQDLHPFEKEHKFKVRASSPQLTVTRRVVSAILRSTSKETSGGPSGLDGHFINAVKYNGAFVDLVLLLAKGIATGKQKMKSLFLGSRIVPLLKNDKGDVRPIAVGEIIYRVIGKAIARSCSFRLLPYQLGCGTKGGVEPLIHYLEAIGNRRGILSIDMKNAFNNLNREVLLKQIQNRAPDLERAFAWAYGNWTDLYISPGCILKSKTGVRQGDPLGPLLFSLGYTCVLEKLEKALVDNGFQNELPMLTYLDDTYLFSHPSALAKLKRVVFDVFDDLAPLTGLKLREDKTWTIEPRIFRSEGVNVLGSHVGGNKEGFILTKTAEFARILQKLSDARLQDTFLLLRQCLQPKFIHLTRTLDLPTTCWEKLDDVLMGFFSRCTDRVGVAEPDKRLVSLPARLGGCGVACYSYIASSAYKASYTHARDMLRHLDPMAPFVTDSGPCKGSQRERMKMVWTALQDDVLSSLEDHAKEVFIDNSSLLGSKWLSSFPSTREKNLF